MNQASPTLPVSGQKIKRGTFRADGYRFDGYCRDKKGKLWEIWLSPEAWHRRATRRRARDRANVARRSANMRKYRAANPEHYAAVQKAWTEANREKVRSKQSAWVRANRERVRENCRRHARKMRADRPDWRLKKAMQCRIYIALRGIRKLGRTQELLGCDLPTLRAWLESQFRNGMAWDNYGPVWHVDHVIPISWFDLTSLEQQKKAFCYTNLQPLFAQENLTKKNRYAG
jgi:hypothetical protein